MLKSVSFSFCKAFPLLMCSSATTLTCDGGVDVVLFNQQVPGALWEPWQQHQLDKGGYHHHWKKQGPVLLLWQFQHMLRTLLSSGSTDDIMRTMMPFYEKQKTKQICESYMMDDVIIWCFLLDDIDLKTTLVVYGKHFIWIHSNEWWPVQNIPGLTQVNFN